MEKAEACGRTFGVQVALPCPVALLRPEVERGTGEGKDTHRRCPWLPYPARRPGARLHPRTGIHRRPHSPYGGDAVSGAATVILAMGAGRKAAAAIIEALEQ